GTRLVRATAANSGQRAKPGLSWVDGFGVEPRNRRRPLGEAGGRGHVGRRVDELTGDVRPATDQRSAVGDRAKAVVAAADHEALDSAWGPAAPPAARFVAADGRTFRQRAYMVVDGEGQRRVEGPRDRPAITARANRARGSRP